MDFLEQVLDEQAAALAATLALVGFSPAEAERFLGRAGPELIDVYRWHASQLRRVDSMALASELLAGIRGRTLAHEVGLPAEKTWAGLRELVPAVLEAHGEVVRSSRTDASTRDGGGGAPIDIGFGLFLQRGPRRPGGRTPIGGVHPVFGRLLPE